MSEQNIDPKKAPISDGAILAEDLLAKCHRMLAELEEFRAFILAQKKEHIVDIRHFHNSVLSELKSLEKLSSGDPTEERTIHTLRSSNLPFYNAVWDAAKSSTGLVTFNKRFYWANPPTRSSKRAGQGKKEYALVDIVAQSGLEWIKVSTITETRLLFELAKAGWEGADSSSSDDDNEYEGKAIADSPSFTSTPSPSPVANSENPVELVRLAIDLRKASLATLIRYQNPTIRLILPKIPTSPCQQTLAILSQLHSTGAKIQYGPQLLPFPTLNPLPIPAPSFSLQTVFTRLLPDPNASLTATLNIDCTILLALISDLSHSPHIPHSPTHHQAITRQITLEARDPLLPDSLYPALQGHDLVCTTEAAGRMREIVAQIGTPSERARGALLFGDEPEKGDWNARCTSVSDNNGSVLARFAATSGYPVPSNLRLPIKIIAAVIDMARLPPVAATVVSELTAINKSVFLYGWQAGITTVSSNRTVVKTIESVISAENAYAQGEGNVKAKGPEVWLCETARSLVGKEKGRRM